MTTIAGRCYAADSLKVDEATYRILNRYHLRVARRTIADL